jgi:hypothetical protein
VSVFIVGAGSRGSNYATFAQMHPDRMRVVGVAEPREYYRQQMAATYEQPPENSDGFRRGQALREERVVRLEV